MPVIGIAGKPGIIYALSSPEGEIRYVGGTRAPLAKRLRQHVLLAASGRCNSPKDKWIRELLAAGLEPAISALRDVCGPFGADETQIIGELRSNGARLTNVSLGGEWGSTDGHSAEIKSKISAARKGMKFSAETCARIKAARQKQTFSAETRAKLSAARLGKKRKEFSAEWRAAIKEGRKRQTFSAETRAKMSASSFARWAKRRTLKEAA